ncbi:hypothetical protein ASPBRDRAFT_43400 [Aspergillus brasiliensis CBS 101740]|uniref:Uncharacterized protein n=1 Tax=Aspergillus brasiliensis (strain CBS 101740 / IMI 381727 / IBT 21946) TaxID=767769 RepID=A0A1L9UJY8_ASPBC|nr:hypothetical protein ASPBRDRAFT_43400 [Aspergillus brasiliensis CBS 101740]
MALLTFSHAVVGLLPARWRCLLSKRKLAQRQWLFRHVRIPDAVRVWSAGGGGLLVTSIPVAGGACFNPGIVVPL